MKIVETAITDGFIKITLAETSPPELDRQWVSLRIALDVDVGWSAGLAQIKGLQLAQSSIEREIVRIQGLLGPSP
jgi:hypothetical protein